MSTALRVRWAGPGNAGEQTREMKPPKQNYVSTPIRAAVRSCLDNSNQRLMSVPPQPTCIILLSISTLLSHQEVRFSHGCFPQEMMRGSLAILGMLKRLMPAYLG